jgi:glycosyltransferase involved in cell wall biosynthesis
MQTAELDRSSIPAPGENRAGVLAAWPVAAPAISKAAKKRIAFLYLGRRGGIARLAYELAVAATRHDQIDPLFVVSDSNELFGLMQTLPGVARSVKTFESSVGALTQTYRIPSLVQRLNAAFNEHRTETIVVLASHVWSPLIAPFLKTTARRYVVVVHDADPHPGDATGLAHGWLLREAAQADLVIALSGAVARGLSTRRRIPSDRIVTLFHPLLTYTEKRARAVWDGERPLRLLFFGRMMDYKGLGIFTDAIALLRAQGLRVDATVAGNGQMNGRREKLEALGATVINRWLLDQELSQLLHEHDAVVLTHTEASQSGCAAAALGAGLPVITTPVGGIMEQIAHDVNGLVADRVDAAAIAHQIERLVNRPTLYCELAQGVVRHQRGREMRDFLDNMMDAIPQYDGCSPTKCQLVESVKEMLPNLV